MRRRCWRGSPFSLSFRWKGTVMDYYQGWFDLKRGVKDTAFARSLPHYMSHLKERGLIEGWKVSARNLGLAPKQFGDVHLVIETRNHAQLDDAFNHVASRGEP